jgi:hypothetical protein
VSNNIEWLEAVPTARHVNIVEPEEFQDENSPYFDTDGTIPENAFGITVDGGSGHTTLVYGTLAELQAWAVEILGEVFYIDRKREGD